MCQRLSEARFESDIPGLDERYVLTAVFVKLLTSVREPVVCQV